MGDWVKTKYSSSTHLNADSHSIFNYLNDFSRSVPDCFPGLADFRKINNDAYEWIFKELRYQSYALNIHFATRFESGAPSEILIHSVPDIGNSRMSGAWKIEEVSHASRLVFEVEMMVALKLPLLVRAIAVPILERELARYFDRYLENVQKHFK